ncbi:SMP-30/gluconolactonase/LRE family protein [Erythrobacter sp. HL-111]|uniref:SMP-30/gluconolactonase/LRE family protein n=1 Tax=Erythrobacter sp. HL-111 TaxID=1798193 RepID=UPI0006DBCCA7|nr:SMP-30/gluconolactonase/LRE family protein [Erythrobacter sp. HL-111]KPP87584.1 MAG: gluconolactonase [Erythrobacteraceae bacterium HL-111]SDR80372.1 gluconolactonase [Erythrobacter sp. HL-111]
MKRTGQMFRPWTRLAALAIAGGAAAACAPMERADQAAEPRGAQSREAAIFVPGTLERVATGFGFTEGPAWDGKRLIFSDIPGDTVHVLDPRGNEVSVLYSPSAQANGHTFNRDGDLLSAEHASGEITRWTPRSGRETIVAEYRGEHLNSPNDLVVRAADGMIFFTDPPYGLGRPYQGEEREREVEFNGVFGFDEATGRMVLIDDSLQRPNGIALSPDESVLYVSDSADQKLWAYDLAADGTASARRLFADLAMEGGEWPVDGMRVDSEGRVYATCPEGICVLSPEGARVATLDMPVRSTNVSWGGSDLSTLYITAGSDVWKVETRARGIGSSIRPAP